MPRPGFVLDVDRSTPPILFHHGERLPPRDAAGRAQPRRLPGRAARAARRPRRRHPPRAAATRSTASRCPRCCTPGMKLTIAFDDISLPLPPMRRPDIRQRVIEAVLDLAAAAGVDDVHLIAALALHRRMTEAELRHAVGDRVYDAFAPHGLLYNHDAEDPDGMAFLGTTDAGRGGRDQQAGGRERPARLRQHQPRRRWTAAGSRPPPAWPATAASATTTTCRRCSTAGRSWTGTSRELHHSNWRMGEVLRDAGVKIFQIETTLNNDTFGRRARCRCCRSGSGSGRRGTGPRSSRMKAGLDRMPAEARRKIFHVVAGAVRHDVGAGRRGRGRARGHDRERASRQQLVAGRGPDRHPHDGAALHLPLQRQLGHEPDPRDVPRARLLLQHVPRASRSCARAAC